MSATGGLPTMRMPEHLMTGGRYSDMYAYGEADSSAISPPLNYSRTMSTEEQHMERTMRKLSASKEKANRQAVENNNTAGDVVEDKTPIKREPGVLDICEADMTERHLTGDDITSSASQPAKNSSFQGNLIIKVIGDSLAQEAAKPEVENRLSKKLGVKVVVQIESPDGEVLHVDTMNHSNGSSHGESSSENRFDGGEGRLFGDQMNGTVSKQEPAITNTVLNTIRDLATRMGRLEQLSDCPICGDAVTGFHYGVQTCESCKGFFKRTVQNKKEFKCLRGGDCEVYLANRKKCPACRFRKCCEVGMRVEGIREDRSRGGRSTYEGASAFLHRRFKRCSDSSDHQLGSLCQKKIKPSEPLSPEPLLSRPVIIPDLLQQILDLEHHYEEVSLVPQPCCINRMNEDDEDKFSSMLHLTEHRLYQIVRWARYLPNFSKIDKADQALLLQNSWAELTALGVVWRSRHTEGMVQLSYGKTIDMAKAKEMDHEEVTSRMLYVCDSFRRLKIDQYEYVALKVLALMLPDVKGLQNRDLVQKYQNELMDAVRVYTTSHYPDIPLKFGELLLRLSEVQRLTAISRQQMIHQTSAEIEKNSLLMDMLRNQKFTKKGKTFSDADALNVIHSNYRNEIIQPSQRTQWGSQQRNPDIAVVAPTTSHRSDHRQRQVSEPADCTKINSRSSTPLSVFAMTPEPQSPSCSPSQPTYSSARDKLSYPTSNNTYPLNRSTSVCSDHSVNEHEIDYSMTRQPAFASPMAAHKQLPYHRPAEQESLLQVHQLNQKMMQNAWLEEQMVSKQQMDSASLRGQFYPYPSVDAVPQDFSRAHSELAHSYDPGGA